MRFPCQFRREFPSTILHDKRSRSNNGGLCWDGGSDEADNLALACQRCNGYRYNFTTGIDPQTQEIVPLFNPRQQNWSDHFIWTVNGLRITGITPIGRATCNRLDLNDERHNEGSIVKARRLWMRGGWHPPDEDPRQG